MTVIAVRDGVMAVDSLVSANGTRHGVAVKWREVSPPHGGGYIAATGDMGLAARAIAGFAASGGDMPEDCGFIHLRADGSVWVAEGGVWYEYEAPFFALGCGEVAALAAMHAGASAERAVEIASEMMPGQCGGHVCVLAVRP